MTTASFRVACAFCLVLLFYPSVFPQAAATVARKFDEFNDILASDLIARLDNVAIQLQNEPNAKAFFVVYRTRRDLPGLSNRYAHRMKGYLIESRGLPADHMVTVDGGIASCLTQEIWIVPQGAAPKPRDDARQSSYQPSVYKFDEHYYGERHREGLYYWRDSYEELLEAFGLELQKHPKSVGYLIAYRDANEGSLRETQSALNGRRSFLVKEYGIKPARLKTIVGGYRGSQIVELWIAHEPGAAPTIMSYRKATKD